MGDQTRAGMVAIVGMPNAGKSSLLNCLLDSKLSIVTPAAQTTRERVIGIDTRGGVQMVFIDTPGIVKPAYLLHHAMIGIIQQAIEDADVVVLLVDATRSPSEIPQETVDLLALHPERLIIALNKVDTAAAALLERASNWSATWIGQPAIAISALTGTGVEELRARIADKLPTSPFLFPDDDISSQSVRFFVSELVRETVFELYEDEIPYSVAVRIEEFREAEDPMFIRAVIYVERDSQKAILIGRNGQGIRQLGSNARRKIEEFVQARVYLDLWIKVLPKWRKSATELRRFGFPVPENKA